MSGMLVLVPLAAPVHATNSSPISWGVGQPYGYVPFYADSGNDFSLTITNPATNQYAITSITVAVPNSHWYIEDDDCGWDTPFTSCSVSPNGLSVEWGTTGTNGIAPGTSSTVFLYVYAPEGSASQTFPYSGTWSTTIQDASSAAYYVGPTFSTQVIADTSYFTNGEVTVTPGGLNTVDQYTAGTAVYTVSAQLSCETTEPGCTSGYQNGVTVDWLTSGYGSAAVYSFGSASQVTAGSGSSAGTVTTTFQPSNIESSAPGIGSAFVEAFVGVKSTEGGCEWCYPSIDTYSADAITTVPGTPASVGFTTGGAAFGVTSTLYLRDEGTTVGTSASYPTGYTGAQLCNTLMNGCGADPQQVAVSVTDKYGNPLLFTSITTPEITFQLASGAYFDEGGAGLASIISNYVPTSSPQPVPDNYYQGPNYGTAGVITATITGSYNGAPFSVSGSSGSILTSTFATTGSFETTDHLAFPVTQVQAGKSVTLETVLGVAQADVPITVAVCDHDSVACSATTAGYTGTVTTASGVTNSSGIYSATLTVDTKAGSVAVLNATVLAPETGDPTNNFVIVPSNTITTIAGPAAKFTVIVGIGSALDPSPISASFPSQTVYVNVVTSDAYGNPVSTVGGEEVAITLTASPSTLSDANPDIPTNCYETNGTSGNGCSAGYGSFGPIAWTLPETVGSTATISATGVLNGVVVTSATVDVHIVSKLPTLNVILPLPLAGVVYSDTANVQFRGWANASAGYNGGVDMKSLGWVIGTGTWQSTSLSATVNATWSVVATLPTGSTTVDFNATDAKGNVAVLTPALQVLVDTQAPVITNVTPSGATLTPGQLFQATIVVDEGDLNATSVVVDVNGTALANSDVTVTGTNNLGHSVTYTLTAVLPTGYDSVTISAASLAGLTGTSATEPVTITVAFADSVTFTTTGATWGQSGAASGIFVPVTNLWGTSQQLTIYATMKSGSSTYVLVGGETLAPGQTGTVFLQDFLVNVPAGTYSVTFSAQTTANQAVSAPTTPISITVP